VQVPLEVSLYRRGNAAGYIVADQGDRCLAGVIVSGQLFRVWFLVIHGAPSIGIPVAFPCPGAARFIPVRRHPQRYVYAQQEGRRLAIRRAGLFDTNFTGAILRVMVTLYWLKISRTAATTRLSSLVSCASSWISSRKVVFIEALPAG
jgi:hypothetical protein